MSKNTRNRILLTAVAALLLVAVTVGGTMAWLQASTNQVTNKFTPTTLSIELHETVPGVDGGSAEMVPGVTIPKDPYVTYTTDVDAYLFVKVTKSANYDTYMEDYIVSNEWTVLSPAKVEGQPYAQEVVFWKSVDADSNTSYDILNPETVKVKTSVTKDLMEDLTDETAYPTLSFQAYIIQSENLVAADGTTAVNDAAGAWAILNP